MAAPGFISSTDASSRLDATSWLLSDASFRLPSDATSRLSDAPAWIPPYHPYPRPNAQLHSMSVTVPDSSSTPVTPFSSTPLAVSSTILSPTVVSDSSTTTVRPAALSSSSTTLKLSVPPFSSTPLAVSSPTLSPTTVQQSTDVSDSSTTSVPPGLSSSSSSVTSVPAAAATDPLSVSAPSSNTLSSLDSTSLSESTAFPKRGLRKNALKGFSFSSPFSMEPAPGAHKQRRSTRSQALLIKQNSKSVAAAGKKSKESKKQPGKKQDDVVIVDDVDNVDDRPPPKLVNTLDFMLQRVIFECDNEVDATFAKNILGSVLNSAKVQWNDVGGLQKVKQQLKELVVWPLLNPDLFRGLRSPGKGLLLFGPPGTGKTMIGKCLATEAKATFFSISASTFASKWYGDTEKIAKTLFQCARALQPSIIFIDEVDALLSKRKDNDGGCSTRLKNELLTHMDGCSTKDDERVLVIGATNLPRNLDEAARRRFTKRVYIPLPDKESREEILKSLLKGEKHGVFDFEFEELADKTEGYSGADLKIVAQAAAMEPLRSLSSILNAKREDVRDITCDDVLKSIQKIPASVDPDSLEMFENFNKQFGTVL